MAQTGTSVEQRTTALPSADSLFVFFDGLRREGYRIDARQIAAAQCLLAEARAGGVDSPATRRIKYRLAPLIAKSPSQQQDFYHRYDALCGAPVVLGRIGPESRATSDPATEAIKRDLRGWAIAGAVAAFLTLAAAATLYFWPQPPPQPPQPAEATTAASPPLAQERIEITQKVVLPVYAALKPALAAAPLLALVAWLVMRWRRRLLLISRGIVLGDAELASVRLPLKLSEVLFTGPERRASAHNLRKHRFLPTHKLDAWQTVDATARQAGLFTPVYRKRPQLPEYVFLIERNSTNDHLARLFDWAVTRLRDEHVNIQRYYFHTDPRQLQADDHERSTVPLAELAARTNAHRLFIIATADGFFHPLTGEVESWVQQLKPWRSRTMLSTRPLEQWTMAELQLLEEGFSLATAEASGFVAAGEKIAVGTDEPELLEGVVVTPQQAHQPVYAIPNFAVFRDVDARWCPEMVALPAGEFLMGLPKDQTTPFSYESPQHRVTIGYRFAIGRYPVTFDEYDHFCHAMKREMPYDAGWGRRKRPVINVSWRDATAYCDWLAKQTGKPYRLPSQAEWKYARQTGTTTRYSFDNRITLDDPNYWKSEFGRMTKVGAYPPNLWGLYDMHSDVWEWVEDVWHDSYQGAPTNGAAWTDGEGKTSFRDRVILWGPSAERRRYEPDKLGNMLRFRVARTLD